MSKQLIGNAPINRYAPPTVYQPIPADAKLLDPAWLRIARTQIGVREKAGGRANSKIVDYLRTCGNLKQGSQQFGQDTDETPWCAAFANWCLQAVGISGTGNALASSFATWGFPMAEVQRGAVVVLRRGSGVDPATAPVVGSHVGFLVALNDTQVRLVGGNQRNAVSELGFSRAAYTLLAVRWPTRTDAPTLATA